MGSNDSHVASFLLHSSDDDIMWKMYKDKKSGLPMVTADFHNLTI